MKRLKNTIITASLFITMITSQNLTQQIVLTPDEKFDEAAFDWSRTFAQVLDIAHKKHYAVADPQENMIEAIKGFVTSLDAHSSFLDPKAYREILESTSGEFYGVGIVIDVMRKTKDKHLTIIDTIADGPSDKVGIQPMDKIVEINDQLLEGLTTEKIVSQLKGERYSTIKVKILREGSPDLLTFEITRDIIKEQHSLSFYIKGHNISYISLSMFTDVAIKQIETLLKKSYAQNAKGLILDLRNNSGGLLNAVIDIAGLFLEKGSLVTFTKDKNGKTIDKYTTKRDPITKNKLPIFILINNYTASAAEILCGCLTKSNDLRFSLGTTTFGKGSVQEVIPIRDCAIKLTTCLYFLPDNTTIQGTGIEPDFVVERTTPPTEQMQWFIKSYGREKTLDNYIKVTKEGVPLAQKEEKEEKKEEPTKKSNTKRFDRAKEMLQSDNQLRECILYINTLDAAIKHAPDLITTRADALKHLKQNHINSEKLEIEEIKM